MTSSTSPTGKTSEAVWRTSCSTESTSPTWPGTGGPTFALRFSLGGGPFSGSPLPAVWGPLSWVSLAPPWGDPFPGARLPAHCGVMRGHAQPSGAGLTVQGCPWPGAPAWLCQALGSIGHD